MGESKRRKQVDSNYGKAPTAYTSYERANKMYDLVFACYMPDPYDENDNQIGCEGIVITWALMLFNIPNTNPLKTKHGNYENFIEWFDSKYPIIQNPETTPYD